MARPHRYTCNSKTRNYPPVHCGRDIKITGSWCMRIKTRNRLCSLVSTFRFRLACFLLRCFVDSQISKFFESVFTNPLALIINRRKFVKNCRKFISKFTRFSFPVFCNNYFGILIIILVPGNCSFNRWNFTLAVSLVQPLNRLFVVLLV